VILKYKDEKEYSLVDPYKIQHNAITEENLKIQMIIREKKQEAVGAIQDEQEEEQRKNPHKIRFESQVEFLNKSDTKKLKDKHLHLVVFEELPIDESMGKKQDKP